MSARKWGTALRRATTLVASTAVLAMIGAGVAAAEVSPSKVTVGSTTLSWSGQGSDANFQQCGTSADPGAGGYQNGATASNYMLWIFSTDGGSVSAAPTLTVNGTQYGNAYQPKASDNQYGYPGAWQIVTPYIDPSTITPTSNAFVSYPPVTDPGNGSWVLTISHGCAGNSGPPAAAPLTVTKTAAGTYDTKYAWNITKAVDKTKVKQIGGQATFNYTVTVSHDSGTPVNYQVNGVVTVNNPNSAPVTITGLTDSLAGGAPQDISGGATQVQPGNTDFSYSFSLGDTPPSSATLDDTATVTWGDQPLADTAGSFLKGDSASGTANTGVFTQDKVIDNSVSVSDPLYSATTPLGTVTVGGDNPAIFTYSNVVNVPQWNCTTIPNTATFTTNDTGTTGSASQSVQVCGPAKTGALTMGYWQNKNGQLQITSANQSALKTYLTGFAPFQDMGTQAVSTYVTNVIKAANASGASMNAMLKAQMLSTALDVYFNPALGSFSMDLTKVYTSSGNYVNSSPAFGGAASMQVSDMLTYAAGQSNVGGTSWYGQNKTTQELAKDAFDAINNQWAFSA